MTDQPGQKPAMGLGDLGGLLGGLTGQQGGLFALLLAALSGGIGGLGGGSGTSGTSGTSGGISDVLGGLGGLLGGAAGGAGSGSGGGAGGGLGDLESVIGGLTGGAGGTTGGTATTTSGIGNLPQSLSQLISLLESKGLGDTAHSWVGTGANQPVSPDALGNALGPELVGQLSTATGMTPNDIVSKLSTALPSIVDKLTPNGSLPATGTP